jgi:hypothetical protein
VISRSLRRFVRDISRDGWSGRREREAISLYVLGYLKDEVRRGGPLSDITQIAIEAPVPQIAPQKMMKLSGRTGVKGDVAKDLLIWPRPRMTCWNRSGESTESPIAVLEWKFGNSGRQNYDVPWLQEYSKVHPRCVGFAITLSRHARGFGLVATRVSRGKRQERWLAIGG